MAGQRKLGSPWRVLKLHGILIAGVIVVIVGVLIMQQFGSTNGYYDFVDTALAPLKP